MNLLTFPLALLRRELNGMGSGARTFRCPVGISRWGGHREVLAGGPEAGTGPYLLVQVGGIGEPPPTQLTPNCVAVLALGVGSRRGQVRAYVRSPDPARAGNLSEAGEPFDLLKFVGPGMHTILLQPAREQGAGPSTEASERWSRSIGALSREVWDRLTGLHYGIIGLGRSGSLLGEAVVRGWGAGRLTLIDPDRVEGHNLGETALLRSDDVGKPKVEAIARHLQRAEPGLDRTRITTIFGSVSAYPALRALLACDALFGCIDHDGARLALAGLTVLFLKPIVDVASGIHGAGTSRRMGVDVRLAVPGERCLLCLGGLADPVRARAALSSADGERIDYARRDWRQERAGSLPSLNQFGTALALRLWEDFVAERVAGSTWVHAEFDPSGRLSVSQPTPAPGPCRLCALAGRGEAGLASVRELFRSASGR